MDVSSPIRSAKTQKLSGEQNMDSIGNLPDVILQYILSFLPTDAAARTSILSKRWQYLWMAVPNLDFKEKSPDKRTLFIDFVEKVLKLHHSSNIPKFSLSCDVLSDASRINSWISAAVGHKVHELNLRLKIFQEPFVLPDCLFTCDSLTHLKLNMGNYLKLPSSISLSSMNILRLEDVILPDDHSMQQLFSVCLVLEDLTIYNCNWENVKAVCISAPMLRKLFISDNHDYEDDDTDDQNDDADDQNNSNGCQVVIAGTSLISFSYIGELKNDYCIYNSSSLVDVRIEVDGQRKGRNVMPREVVYHAHKLLRGFSNVKSLIISVDTVEILDQAEEFFTHLPVFNNLTHLQFDWATVSFDCGVIQKILQNSPCLNSIDFTGSVYLGSLCDEDDWILDPVPPCFLTHLKTIKIGDYYGDEGDVETIKVLLKYATVLETIEIFINQFHFEYNRGGLDELEEVEEELLRLPRASGCEMIFPFT